MAVPDQPLPPSPTTSSTTPSSTSTATVNVLELQLKEGRLIGHQTGGVANQNPQAVILAQLKTLAGQLPNPNGKYGIKFDDETSQNKLVMNLKGLKWVRKSQAGTCQYQFSFKTQDLLIDGQKKDASFIPQFATMLEKAGQKLQNNAVQLTLLD